MALFRAAETVRPASQRLFADSFAEHFLRPGLRRAVWLARRPALGSFLNRYADQRTNIAACTSAPPPSK
jgi:O-methyltransferase involved in polyketide biosynthesis